MSNPWTEKFPKDTHAIKFCSTTKLLDNNTSRNYSLPFSEQFQQDPLDIHVSPQFETLNRDYVLLKSPGYTSWQHNTAQRDYSLEIFHSDTIRVPKLISEETPRRGADRTLPMLRKWYLEGLTRVNVEGLLQKYFKLAFPINLESTANHWVPAAIPFMVEVQLDIWEERLAIFFDGNISTSMLSLSGRIINYEWKNKIQAEVLGEKYLALWKAKWPNDNTSPASIALANDEDRLASLKSTEVTTDSYDNNGTQHAALQQVGSRSSIMVRKLLPYSYPTNIYLEPFSGGSKRDSRSQ